MGKRKDLVNKADVVKALEEVNKQGEKPRVDRVNLEIIASSHNMSRSTLYRKRRGQSDQHAPMKKKHRVFSDEEEKSFVDAVANLALTQELTSLEIRQEAFQHAKRLKLDDKITAWCNSTATYQWFKRFMERRPEIKHLIKGKIPKPMNEAGTGETARASEQQDSEVVENRPAGNVIPDQEGVNLQGDTSQTSDAEDEDLAHRTSPEAVNSTVESQPDTHIALQELVPESKPKELKVMVKRISNEIIETYAKKSRDKSSSTLVSGIEKISQTPDAEDSVLPKSTSSEAVVSSVGKVSSSSNTLVSGTEKKSQTSDTEESVVVERTSPEAVNSIAEINESNTIVSGLKTNIELVDSDIKAVAESTSAEAISTVEKKESKAVVSESDTTPELVDSDITGVAERSSPSSSPTKDEKSEDTHVKRPENTHARSNAIPETPANPSGDAAIIIIQEQRRERSTGQQSISSYFAPAAVQPLYAEPRQYEPKKYKQTTLREPYSKKAAKKSEKPKKPKKK